MANTTFKQSLKKSFRNGKEKVWSKKRARVRLHRSFKRSYREDYVRELKVPGLMHHAMSTLKIILKNWKLFLGLILFATVLNIALVGLMSERTYTKFQEVLEQTNTELADGKMGNFAKAGLLLISTVTTGGLSQDMGEAQQVFAVLIFLLIWLVTIYILRQILAGKKVKLRDGLYNALTPLISTMMVLLVVALHFLPIIIVIVVYSAAVSSEFLNTPFYALVFFVFAAAMLILSGYLLAGSSMALVAVTAPGLYPMAALNTAADLMQGRRMRWIIRLVYAAIMIVILWVIVMLPIVLLDMWLKSTFAWLEGIPLVSLALLIMTCFSFVYLTAYVYLYYRRVLYHDHKG